MGGAATPDPARYGGHRDDRGDHHDDRQSDRAVASGFHAIRSVFSTQP